MLRWALAFAAAVLLGFGAFVPPRPGIQDPDAARVVPAPSAVLPPVDAPSPAWPAAPWFAAAALDPPNASEPDSFRSAPNEPIVDRRATVRRVRPRRTVPRGDAGDPD